MATPTISERKVKIEFSFKNEPKEELLSKQKKEDAPHDMDIDMDCRTPPRSSSVLLRAKQESPEMPVKRRKVNAG